ncbi:MAG: VCBS repeat-containing protein [Planctomycetota bacterium]
MHLTMPNAKRLEPGRGNGILAVMKRTAISFLWLAACLLSLVTAYAEDESPTYPVGIENYYVINLAGPANMPNCVVNDIKTIDLNEDGLLDILYTFEDANQFIILNDPHRTSGYAGIAFQRPAASKNPPFAEVPDQYIGLDAKASLVSAGHYDAKTKGKQIVLFGTDGIGCYRMDASQRYNPAMDSFLKIPTMFRYPPTDAGAPPDYTSVLGGNDLNNDGLDDLIIPTLSGYSLFTDSGNAAFSFGTVNQQVGADEYSFVNLSAGLPGLMLVDLNGDGLKDIISCADNSITYYVQPFNQPKVFTLKFLSGSSADDIAFKSVYFSDLNRDGTADLIITTTGGNITNQLMTRVFVFNGVKDAAGAVNYAEMPSQIINIKGISPMIRLADINGDGYPDLFVTSFETDLGSNIKKALLRYVVISYQAFFYSPGANAFSASPNYSKSINFPLSALGQGQFSHIYMEYDFTGDRVPDLMYISGPDRRNCNLYVMPGRPKDELIKKSAVGFRKDEYLLYPLRIPDTVIIKDLNNDGKCDLILKYRSRMTMLISK